jgi:NifB/MoaA-like Fe-S oxidoreductase
LAEAQLPDASYYGDFPQIENGVGAVAMLRQRVAASARRRLPRRDGMRIGVVTGSAMAPLMPPLLDVLKRATGARFELISCVNSLFGPTTTTAGLLVGADISTALAGRHDLDFALIPAESINDSGVFLDDVRLVDLQRALPIPVTASYDFVDALRADVLEAA